MVGGLPTAERGSGKKEGDEREDEVEERSVGKGVRDILTCRSGTIGRDRLSDFERTWVLLDDLDVQQSRRNFTGSSYCKVYQNQRC